MRLLVFIFFIFFTTSLFSKENKTYIGILYEKIFTTKKEARIASVIWTKYMEDKGYENVIIKFYQDENILIADYLNNKVSTLLGTYEMYYKNKSILEHASKRRWVPAVRREIFEQYYLIKNKTSDISLDKLENKTFYYRNSIGKKWLESLVLEKYKKPISKVFSKVVEIKKAQKLIFNVFFNKNELSVVSKDLYDDMIQLNPQIKNKIEILEKSKSMFISAIGFSSKKISLYYNDMLKMVKEDIDKKGVIRLSESINIHSFYDISNEELKPLDRFFSDYLILKNKYN